MKPRPWQSAVPCLPKSVTRIVQFPTDEEEEGLVLMAWRGTSAMVGVANSSYHVLPSHISFNLCPPYIVIINLPFCCSSPTLISSKILFLLPFPFLLHFLLLHFPYSYSSFSTSLPSSSSSSLSLLQFLEQDRYGIAAMECLLQYLSETSVAPLQRQLVEVWVNIFNSLYSSPTLYVCIIQYLSLALQSSFLPPHQLLTHPTHLYPSPN